MSIIIDKIIYNLSTIIDKSKIFEDDRLINLNVEDLNQLLKTGLSIKDTKNLFFDEIQNIENWEKFVGRLNDQGYNIYVTGSSSKLLSKEISTSLRRRTIKIEVMPLNFVEFLKFKGFKLKEKLSNKEQATVLKYLKEYMEFGGFPEVCLYEEKERILKEYLDDIFYKDVVERFKVRDLKGAKVLRNVLLNFYSSELSIKNIVNMLKVFNTKISRETIYNYLEHFEEAYFIFLVNKFSYKVSDQIRNSKLYLIDGMWRLANRFSPNHGKIFENLVFLELKKYGKNIYYYKKNSWEIDFVVDNCLMQVCYELNDENLERETRGLKNIEGKEKYIITFNQFDEIGDIKVIPFWYLPFLDC